MVHQVQQDLIQLPAGQCLVIGELFADAAAAAAHAARPPLPAGMAMASLAAAAAPAGQAAASSGAARRPPASLRARRGSSRLPLCSSRHGSGWPASAWLKQRSLPPPHRWRQLAWRQQQPLTWRQLACRKMSRRLAAWSATGGPRAGFWRAAATCPLQALPTPPAKAACSCWVSSLHASCSCLCYAGRCSGHQWCPSHVNCSCQLLRGS